MSYVGHVHSDKGDPRKLEAVLPMERSQIKEDAQRTTGMLMY